MRIRDVIEQHGYLAEGGSLDVVAEAWGEAGFDAHEVAEWLAARCFDPSSARDLADLGVTPEMAQMKTSAGASEYTDTVGFKVSNSDIEPEEARDLLGAF